MKIVGINQPYYLPYIGLFERIKACDHFVINPFCPLNCVKSFHRRVKIIQQNKAIGQEYLYLTQCVSIKKDGIPFNEIALSEQFYERQEIHAKTIRTTYKRSPFYEYLKELPDLLNSQAESLSEYNTKLIVFLADKLGLRNKIIDGSKNESLRNLDGTATALLLCHTLKGDTHIAGQNGPLWLDERKLKENNIDTYYQKVEFIPYRQFPGRKTFVSGLSIIDLLFNYGPDANKMLGFNSRFVDKQTLLETTKLTGR